MKQIILVFIGGGFGSVLRFIISKYINHSGGFPVGTFVANVLGSLIIGLILGLALKQNSLTENQTLLLGTGFCGGFTTFSTFAYENQSFLRSGDFTLFAVYTISTFVLGFLAVFAGMYIVRS